MKLKIIFCEPPLKDIQGTQDEKLIIIQSPYKIIQANIGDTREYEKLDGSKMPEDFTYEQYCKEMRALIHSTLDKSDISEHVYHQIIIEGFNQPPNFKTLCSKIEKEPLSCASNSKILFENCSFGGKQYTQSTGRLIRSLQKHHGTQHQESINFKIVLADHNQTYLSKHDEDRLALLKDVVVYRNNEEVSLKAFRDDSLIGIQKSSLTSKLEAPTFFYRNAINTMQEQTTAEMVLKNFFSQEAQQESDFTCGPATVKMVADFFDSMRNQTFGDAPVTKPEIWHTIKQKPEMVLAEQLNTLESEGSAIPEIRIGLMEMGITVFDDKGLSNKDQDEEALNNHKSLLWNKIHQILKMGIPVILNMQDRTGCGHFEVVIGIEKGEKGEHIILAEPGTALVGHLEFEHIPKDKFLARWKNMSGEFHGRFMVLSPNEASSHRIDTILADLPHYKNGKAKNKDLNNDSAKAKEMVNRLLLLTKEYQATLDPKKTQILSLVDTLLEKLDNSNATKNEVDCVKAFYEFLDSPATNTDPGKKGSTSSLKNIEILKQNTSIPTSNFLLGIAVIAATLATGILPGVLIAAVVYAVTKRHPFELIESRGEKFEKNLEQIRSSAIGHASFFKQDIAPKTTETPVVEQHTNHPKGK